MRRAIIRRLTVMAATVFAMVAFASPAWAATFTVNSTGDAGDNATSDGVCATNNLILIGSEFVAECTLRAAIQQANTTSAPDGIAFGVPGASGAAHTITPASELPDVTRPATIDGYTQPGSSPNTLANGTNARPKIELSGAGFALLARNGLDIDDPISTVRGLVINRWDTAVRIRAGSQNNKIEGNFLGTDASGTQDLGNGNGVVLEGLGHTVGGETPAARNLISGNSSGVAMYGLNHQIEGNLIGTTANGAGSLGNSGNGVSIRDSTQTFIGGRGFKRNVIAFNGANGISVSDDAKGSRILSNSIHSNGALGMDLAGDGVTPNDLKDPDTGANDLQNYPALSSAIKSGPTTTIKGTLNSTPNRSFTIQFFSSPQANPSGFGEGQTLVGQTTVETDARGNASFVFRPARAVPVGQKVSATATDDPAGNTSEFSRAVQVAPDRTRPTITRPAPRPGAALRRPNVSIQATVGDGQMELAKRHIRLFVDGRRKTGFTYNPAADRLSFAARNLSSGRHNVRVVAFDDAGNAASRTWSFRVVRR